MTTTSDIPDLAGAVAVILHRPHTTVDAIARQLTAIGLRIEQRWPELSAVDCEADFVFFDADRGYDQQFPWPPGEAPVALIALIESEAPGRIEWALRQGADAELIKPVGNTGVYASLLISRHSLNQRRQMAEQLAELRRRLAERRTIVQAAFALNDRARLSDGDAAYLQLRTLAMNWRISMEDAARRIVATAISEEDERSTRV